MDIEVQAMNDTYDLAKKDAEDRLVRLQSEVGVIREEARALGVLQKISYDNAHNELLKYAMLYQVKQNKEYKKEGMTWDKFCEAAGENVRNVDRTLKDLKAIYDIFSDKLSDFLSVPFNKIKYLGKSISDNLSEIENGNLIIDGTHIPLTPDNKEDIEAAIDTLIETHKKENEALKKKLDKTKKDRDKIIAEETKTLTVEKDALVKEVARLKAFDPSEKDITWAQDYLDKMKDLVVAFDVAVRKFIMDERLHDDMSLQAQCQVFIDTMVRHTRGLQQDWDAEFNVDYTD